MLNCAALKVMVFNARSLCNKTYGVCEFLRDNNCDICFVTEAWIKTKDESVIAEIMDLGYNIKFQPRKGSKRGGGICVLFKPNLNVEKCKLSTTYKSFEVLQTTVKSSHSLLRISTFYRTGILSIKKRTEFLHDLENYLESLVHLKGENILCGDFNVHVEDVISMNTTGLFSITESFGFSQLVNESTHRDGGILDLLFVQDTGVCKNIAKQSLFVHDLCHSLTSDHKFIECLIPFFKDPPKPPKVTSFRNFNDINVNNFCQDLKEKLQLLNPSFYPSARGVL